MSAFQHPTELAAALDALEKDLLHEQISTVRNYNFAILPYLPEHEFALRASIQRLSEKLKDAGWNTATIALHSLLLERVRAQGSEFIDATIAREKHLAGSVDKTRGLRLLKERVVTLLEGPDGLAKDVIREIERVIGPPTPGEGTQPAKTVIFLGRAGALYPFFRTSALLKHVAGHTRNTPVVLLYPGKLIGETGLSFMGVLPADRDYRPRIYR